MAIKTCLFLHCYGGVHQDVYRFQHWRFHELKIIRAFMVDCKRLHQLAPLWWIPHWFYSIYVFVRMPMGECKTCDFEKTAFFSYADGGSPNEMKATQIIKTMSKSVSPRLNCSVSSRALVPNYTTRKFVCYISSDTPTSRNLVILMSQSTLSTAPLMSDK